MKERIRERLLKSGALAVGFSKAGALPEEVDSQYASWIEEGFNGEMGYIARHRQLRAHTDNVLRGAETVISIAFSYVPEEFMPESGASVAAYAYGEDYHNVLRKILAPVVDEFKKEYGGDWRICIDSAPVAERYWAMKSGVGKRGLNGCVIVEGAGPMNFLVEVLTTLALAPDETSEGWCSKCGKCLKVCPTGALRGNGTMDARLCINYLTIEKKGEFTQEEKVILNGNATLLGCDRCLRVCGEGKPDSKNTFPEFRLSNSIRFISGEELERMDAKEFKEKFGSSPLGYSGLERLLRNYKLLDK